MNIVAYGGGINSTAMLIGLVERQIPVDLILFANTGGEKPSTYWFVALFSRWLQERGYPEVIEVQKVRRTGELMTLEQDCLEKHMLPSLAYGFKTCSQKYKTEPQNKYVRNWKPAKELWKRGEKITKFIGYHAEEQERAGIYPDKRYHYSYPLIEWNWGKAECLAAINRAEMPIPPKSACFFCPSMRKQEIFDLKSHHPDLLERALILERNADLISVPGLGRRFAWANLVLQTELDLGDFPECDIELSCGCYDG